MRMLLKHALVFERRVVAHIAIMEGSFRMAVSAPSPEEITAGIVASEQAFYGPFFGSLGVSAAMIFTAAGSAYGTCKSGTGISSMAVARPDLVMKAIIPVVMAGICLFIGFTIISINYDCILTCFQFFD